ncbi:hypothetical protein C8R43DRAFT_1121042 [Mycena crocata]|nr:hypothetical protein C8R43DRAFT_1121042 [Mycena crocata]
MAALSKCGLALPLQPDFDHQLHMALKPDKAIPQDMMLQERNAANHHAESRNRASRIETRAHMEAAADGTLAAGQDVGPHIVAYYAYTDAEIEMMIANPDLCKSAWAPLPPMMEIYCGLKRTERAAAEKAEVSRKEKEKEDEKKCALSVDGSLIFKDPTPFSLSAKLEVGIPQIFKNHLSNRMLLPLHFWSNEFLLQVIERSEILKTLNVVPIAHILNNASAADSKTRIMIVDVAKMELVWGPDDGTRGLDPFQWDECFQNMLVGLEPLCPVQDPANIIPSYHTELTKHYQFFRNQPEFRKHFELWYDVERDLRYKLFAGPTAKLFVPAVWDLELSSCYNTYKGLKRHFSTSVPYSSSS